MMFSDLINDISEAGYGEGNLLKKWLFVDGEVSISSFVYNTQYNMRMSVFKVNNGNFPAKLSELSRD